MNYEEIKDKMIINDFIILLSFYSLNFLFYLNKSINQQIKQIPKMDIEKHYLKIKTNDNITVKVD